MAMEKSLETAFGMALKRLWGYLRGELNQEAMEEPWHTISGEMDPWTNEFKELLVSRILSINPGGKVKFLNVLLLGQVGSGKSSFINTCDTAISNEGRVKSILTVLQSSSSSVSKRLETIPLKTKQGKEIPLRLFDCRGLHKENGVPTEVIRLIVDGHVDANYTINPVAPISSGDKCYRTHPKLEDQMHCIVYVINANNPIGHLTQNETQEQLRGIIDSLHQRNIPVPQAVLLTKVDLLDICNTQDLKLIFRSHIIQAKRNEAAQYIGLHPKDVYPMSNYCNQQVPSLERDILALFNLYNIMAKANDFVEIVAGDDSPPGFKDDKSDDLPSGFKDNKNHDFSSDFIDSKNDVYPGYPGFKDGKSNASPSCFKDNKKHDLSSDYTDNKSDVYPGFKDDKSNDSPARFKGVKNNNLPSGLKDENSDHLPLDFMGIKSNDLPPSFNDDKSKTKED